MTTKIATPAETQRRRRGHMFYPTQAVLRKIPALRATDGMTDQKVWAHYFMGSMDWFILELDPDTGEAFAFTITSTDSEYGYVSLPELEAAGFGWQVVERDMHWTQESLASVVRRYTTR